MKDTDHNVIIIGGGPAGLAALMWCDELRLNAILLEKNTVFGGQLLLTHNPITNYPGVDVPDGKALRDILLRQLQNRGLSGHLQAEIASIDHEDKTVELIDGREISACAIIIATGVRRRKLGIEGEAEFAGKGILESGSSEKESVAGKRVLIVGGGDAALENALILSEYAERVYVAHRRREFTARQEFVERVKAAGNVEFIFGVTLARILGRERVESVELESVDSRATQNLDIDAVLIRIGVEPNSELVRGKLEIDERGYIVVDSRCETSVKGVYAIGDVASPISPTISTAVGTAAAATKAIFAWLNQ